MGNQSSAQSVRLTGSGPVHLTRNADGVPVIETEGLNDALFGLGYAHARDRGMQMLLLRTLGRGEACEKLKATPEMLGIDLYFRRWNLGSDVAEESAALSSADRATLQSYCDGLNHYFAHAPMPWELRLLGCRFEPWTFADVFLTAKIAGLVALAQTQAEAERFIVQCVQNGITRDKLEELFPGHLNGLDEALLRQVVLGEAVVPEEIAWASALPRMVASNNWALAGSKTASGKPMLCSDPHLEVNRLPAVWYEAVLRWGSAERRCFALGATLPGVPGVIIGRTPHLAWSPTYAFMDCIDSWIEDCKDGKYRRGNEWLPFKVRKEFIRSKKSPPKEVVFYENDHGVLDGNPSQPGYKLTTQWSARTGTSAKSVHAAIAILTAETVEAGQAILGKLSNSSWNWLLADEAGNIGYQMSGQMPRRRPGTSGLVPLPGWDPENDWHGFEPPEHLPRALNPKKDFLVTANEDLNRYGKVHPQNLPMADYRAARLRQKLSAAREVGIAHMQALQMDFYSKQAEGFMTLLNPLLSEAGEAFGEAKQLLLQWDLYYRNDSQAAHLFEAFYRELILEVFGNAEGGFGNHVLSNVFGETCIFFDFYGNFDRIMLAERSVWFGQRSRKDLYLTALKRALSTPLEPYGKARHVRMAHLLFGKKLPLWMGFDRELIIPGSRATVHQGQIYRAAGRETSFAPSYRFITDFVTQEAHTNLPGGPSDRRFSRWYANGVEDWARGNYKVLASG